MTINIENLLNSIMESIDRVSFVSLDELPNIDLYMDQVTTFMEKKLRDTTRNKGVDKVLTKTMINNYAKNDLLPPPVKKKYSKEHILVLIFIYYYKNILSISDIQMLLNPLTDKYFDAQKEGLTFSDIYEEVTSLADDQIAALKADIKDKYKKSTNNFKDAISDDKEFLQLFSFICMLSFDVYVKKLLIEKLLDEFKRKQDEAEYGADKKDVNAKKKKNKKDA